MKSSEFNNSNQIEMYRNNMFYGLLTFPKNQVFGLKSTYPEK